MGRRPFSLGPALALCCALLVAFLFPSSAFRSHPPSLSRFSHSTRGERGAARGSSFVAVSATAQARGRFGPKFPSVDVDSLRMDGRVMQPDQPSLDHTVKGVVVDAFGGKKPTTDTSALRGLHGTLQMLRDELQQPRPERSPMSQVDTGTAPNKSWREAWRSMPAWLRVRYLARQRALQAPQPSWASLQTVRADEASDMLSRGNVHLPGAQGTLGSWLSEGEAAALEPRDHFCMYGGAQSLDEALGYAELQPVDRCLRCVRQAGCGFFFAVEPQPLEESRSSLSLPSTQSEPSGGLDERHGGTSGPFLRECMNQDVLLLAKSLHHTGASSSQVHFRAVSPVTTDPGCYSQRFSSWSETQATI